MSSQGNLSAGSVGRFLGSGVFNTVVGFSIIAAGLALGLEPNAANALGYALAFALAYLVQRHWVFSGRRGNPAKFVVAAGLSYAANLIVLNALLFAGLLPILAQLGGMSTYTLSFLLLSSLWVFRHATAAEAGEGMRKFQPRAEARSDGRADTRSSASRRPEL